MPVYMSASYSVLPQSVERCKKAIQEFVEYVRENEPGTRVYAAWQQQDDITAFLHHMIFEDEAAEQVHANSDAVKKLSAALYPELTEKVVFTPYRLVAVK